MMFLSPPPERYSADVRLELDTQGRVLELAKSGPGYAFLREPLTVPVGDAELVMTVDGRRYRWQIWLTCETTPIDGKVEFQIVSGPACELSQPADRTEKQLSLGFERP